MSIDIEPMGLWRYRLRVHWPRDETYEGFEYETWRFGERRAREHARLVARLPWCRPFRTSA